jgi:hypothetical protein
LWNGLVGCVVDGEVFGGDLEVEGVEEGGTVDGGDAREVDVQGERVVEDDVGGAGDEDAEVGRMQGGEGDLLCVPHDDSGVAARTLGFMSGEDLVGMDTSPSELTFGVFGPGEMEGGGRGR